MTTMRYPPYGPGEERAQDSTPLQAVAYWTGEAITAMAKADLIHDTLPSKEADEGERKACASLGRVARANLYDLSIAVERAQEAYQNLIDAMDEGRF